MKLRTIETARGIKGKVREYGSGKGKPLLYLHGTGGLLADEPLLEQLSDRFRVFAPEWPGYGEEETEEQIEDMLDFSLHGWDIVRALELSAPPILVGHSMGGMIAAEMACLAPQSVDKLVLIASAGLWIEEHPIPDLFATLPFELASLLFHDAEAGVKLLTGGADFNDMEALQDFLVRNARQLGTAGKILFPIPNRRLSKRLYRMTAKCLVLWGREDKFIDPVYAERFCELLPDAELRLVDAAGHMVPNEEPETVAKAILDFAG